MGRAGNSSENVIIREGVKYRVFSRSKQAEAAGILLMPQRQYRAVGCKAMDTLTIKSIYYDFSQTPFPIGLVGKDIDGIDLLLFDSELAEDFTHLVDNPIYLTQEKIKKHIRKTQYIIDKLKEVDFREYFEKKEFFLLNCLDKFDKAFLKRFIRQELQQTDSLDNLHGINLENIHQHLTNPRLTNYYNDFDKKTENCWTVLDEDPNELKRGYQVVYSELRKQFGLAIKTSNTKPDIGTLVGWYGSFVSTLNGM